MKCCKIFKECCIYLKNLAKKMTVVIETLKEEVERMKAYSKEMNDMVGWMSFDLKKRGNMSHDSTTDLHQFPSAKFF